MNKNSLSTLIHFLEKSMLAYDAGHEDEVVRMAQTIVSFLSKDPDDTFLFLSTAGRYLPNKTLPYLGLVSVEQEEEQVRFLAVSQSGQESIAKWISLADYLGEIIFDDNNLLVSRHDVLHNLCGTCKNQSFDRELDALYTSCHDQFPRDPDSAMKNLYTGGIPYALMRQIAYELHASLDSSLKTSCENRKKLDRVVELAKIGDKHYFYEKKDDFAYNRLLCKDKRVTRTETRILFLDTCKTNDQLIEKSVMLPQ